MERRLFPAASSLQKCLERSLRYRDVSKIRRLLEYLSVNLMDTLDAGRCESRTNDHRFNPLRCESVPKDRTIELRGATPPKVFLPKTGRGIIDRTICWNQPSLHTVRFKRGSRKQRRDGRRRAEPTTTTNLEELLRLTLRQRIPLDIVKLDMQETDTDVGR